PGGRGPAQPRRAGRRESHRAALPAGLPRQGDHRRGDRGPRLARVGRGGEPAARAEGGPGIPAGGLLIPATKTARHAVIRDVILTQVVRSQADLQDLLADRGVTATQATLSRDLDELRAYKVRSSDGAQQYALPPEGG